MFWKRSKKIAPSIVTPYGIFAWDGEFSWACEDQIDNRGHGLSLTYIGSQFNPADLCRFEQALCNLDKLSRDALAVNQKEIEFYGHRADQMTLSGITVDANADEDMYLDFDFENWPDGGLSVHFKNQQVIRSEIDD